MKKYYNFETMFVSMAKRVTDYLNYLKLDYELSKADKYYHFEILCKEEQAIIINNYIDSISIVNA